MFISEDEINDTYTLEDLMEIVKHRVEKIVHA